MILHVDPSDSTPVYEQIREQILTMISTGSLAPGVQLPTIRQLASDLGLAKGTVSRAYETLLHDGAIISRGRHGTHVANKPRALLPTERAARLDAAANSLALAAIQLGVSPDEAIQHFTLAWQRIQTSAA
jgi:DNA-binding transcriptional regulator YhcF (GntR family)